MRVKNRLFEQIPLLLVIGSVALTSSGCRLIERLSSAAAVAADEVAVDATPTRTPWPTFTPTAPLDVASLIPTATNTPEPEPPTPTPEPPTPAPEPPTPTPKPIVKANVFTTLNVRSGPSTAYSRLGQVTDGYSSDVLGRNEAGDWLVINYSGGQGWIAAEYANVEGDLSQIAVRQVDPPPARASNPAPQPAPQQQNPAPAPAASKWPYSLTNVFGEVNGGITQIRGYVQDRNGNPKNGVRVQVRIGSFCTVSVPSGTPGVYPAGNYDILLRPYASEGVWQVSIVDRPTNPEDFKCDPAAQYLSEEVRVTTNTTEGVTYVEWKEN